MTRKLSKMFLNGSIDIYVKGGRRYFVFDARDDRYKNAKSFGPCIRSIGTHLFNNKWELKEAYYEYGTHVLKFYHKTVGGDFTFQVREGHVFVISVENGVFDSVPDDIFVENYVPFER